MLLDAYKGWSIDQLKKRCRELCRVSMRRDMIIAVLATEGIDGLNLEDQETVKRILSQYDSED